MVGLAVGIGVGLVVAVAVGLVVGVGVGAWVRETVSPKLVAVDVDGAVDGVLIGAAVSWPEPVCSTTR